jgi:hypothetical protein
MRLVGADVSADSASLQLSLLQSNMLHYFWRTEGACLPMREYIVMRCIPDYPQQVFMNSTLISFLSFSEGIEIVFDFSISFSCLYLFLLVFGLMVCYMFYFCYSWSSQVCSML